MFYILNVSDYVRVEPELFAIPIKEAIKTQLEKQYENYIDEEMGIVVGVLEVTRVGEGILIPKDPATYYDSDFKILVYKPQLQEVVYGVISKISSFGAFVNIGVMDAMIHISQTMDDYVDFSKSNVLLGRNTKRTLKKGDVCIARIVAISYKTMPPKIGLTMRQPGLGKIEWLKAKPKEKKKKEKKKK